MPNFYYIKKENGITPYFKAFLDLVREEWQIKLDLGVNKTRLRRFVLSINGSKEECQRDMNPVLPCGG